MLETTAYPLFIGTRGVQREKKNVFPIMQKESIMKNEYVKIGRLDIEEKISCINKRRAVLFLNKCAVFTVCKWV